MFTCLILDLSPPKRNPMQTGKFSLFYRRYIAQIRLVQVRINIRHLTGTLLCLNKRIKGHRTRYGCKIRNRQPTVSVLVDKPIRVKRHMQDISQTLFAEPKLRKSIRQ